jgi:hypothetical protein
MDNSNSDNKITNDVSHNTSLDRTQNAQLEPLGPESSTFQEITDDQSSDNGWTEDQFSSLIADRLKDEALQEFEDSSIGNDCVRKSLLLTSELAGQIHFAVNTSQASETEFELVHDGKQIVSVRMSRRKLQENHIKADRLSWRSEE